MVLELFFVPVTGHLVTGVMTHEKYNNKSFDLPVKLNFTGEENKKGPKLRFKNLILNGEKGFLSIFFQYKRGKSLSANFLLTFQEYILNWFHFLHYVYRCAKVYAL